MSDVQPLEQEQPKVHQVSLAPTAVTLQLVDQVGRHLFVAARQVVGDPHRPTGSAHQRRFHEIMRHDLA